MAESNEDKVRRYTEDLKSGKDPKRALKRLFDLDVAARVFQELETRKWLKRYTGDADVGKYADRLKHKLKSMEKALSAERKRQRSGEGTSEDPRPPKQAKKEEKRDDKLSCDEFRAVMGSFEHKEEREKPDYSKFRVSKMSERVVAPPKPANVPSSSVASSSARPPVARQYSPPVVEPPPRNLPPNPVQKPASGKSAAAMCDEKMFKPRKEKLKVFAGKKKRTVNEVQPLLHLCQEVLENHVNYIGYVGWAPYQLLRPALLRCSVEQLRRIFDINPQMAEDADEMFHEMIQREFPKYADKERSTGVTWRMMYDKLVVRKDKKEKERLEMLTSRIGKAGNVAEAGRRTMIIDSAHTNIRRGPAFWAPQQSSIMTATPSAIDLSQARKNIKGGKSQLRTLTAPVRTAINLSRPSTSSGSGGGGGNKKQQTKTAPLMAKVKKMMRR